jgi:hypothetical protein
VNSSQTANWLFYFTQRLFSTSFSQPPSDFANRRQRHQSPFGPSQLSISLPDEDIFANLQRVLTGPCPDISAIDNPSHELGQCDFVLPAPLPCGNYVLAVRIGHLEVNDVGKDLDEVEKSGEMKQYLPAVPNLILADYLESRWYASGECFE